MRSSPIQYRQGYKSYLISTIVDYVNCGHCPEGYKSYLISTIVDNKTTMARQTLGYKSYLISTIVDSIMS